MNPRIVADMWSGVSCHEEMSPSPTLEDFERLLERLDARTFTMLTLQFGGEQHMTIGGGAGRYVVYATADNEEFWNLLRPEPADGVVMLNAGGQEGDYPAVQVVIGSERVWRAAPFCARGTWTPTCAGSAHEVPALQGVSKDPARFAAPHDAMRASSAMSGRGDVLCQPGGRTQLDAGA